MILTLRAMIFLMGLLFVWIGIGFLVAPSVSGGDFGLMAMDNRGLSSIRADFTAFFWVSGGAFLIGAWQRNGTVLLVTVALMGIVLAGRAVSLALDGTYEGWFLPMMVEALAVMLGLAGWRFLPEVPLSPREEAATFD